MGRKDASGGGSSKQGQTHQAPTAKYRKDIGKDYDKKATKQMKKELRSQKNVQALDENVSRIGVYVLGFLGLFLAGAYAAIIYFHKNQEE